MVEEYRQRQNSPQRIFQIYHYFAFIIITFKRLHVPLQTEHILVLFNARKKAHSL